MFRSWLCEILKKYKSAYDGYLWWVFDQMAILAAIFYTQKFYENLLKVTTEDSLRL